MGGYKGTDACHVKFEIPFRQSGGDVNLATVTYVASVQGRDLAWKYIWESSKH